MSHDDDSAGSEPANDSDEASTDTLAVEDALAVANDLDTQLNGIEDDLSRGPGPNLVEKKFQKIEAAAKDLQTMVDGLNGAIEALTNGYDDGLLDLNDGASDAYDRAAAAQTRLSHLRDILESVEDAGPAGEITVNGQRYQVVLKPITEEGDDDA